MRGIEAAHCVFGPGKSSVPGELFLQPHVFLCRGKRHWVILDVNRDKYLCVDRRQFELLGPALKGWAAPSHSSPGAAPRARSTVELAKSLLSLDILSDQPDPSKDAV